MPISRVKAVNAFLCNVDLSDQVEVPDAASADYLGALVLAYVGEALYSLNEKPRSPTEPDGIFAQLTKELAYHREQALVDMSLEAMDAP